MLRAPIVLIFNLIKLIYFLWASFWYRLGHFLTRKQQKYVTVKLESDYAFGPGQGLAALFQTQSTFLEFREDIKRLTQDRYLDGVVLITDGLAMGLARSRDMRDLLATVRASGKRIIAHSQMATLRDYSLASVADEILMTPAGRLYMFGLRFDQYFGAETLSRLGVVTQFVHIGPFKTASHRFIHNSMTTPQRLMMRQLFEGLRDQYQHDIATSRKLSVETVAGVFRDMPLDTRRAMHHKLIDGESFRQNVSSWIARGPQTEAAAASAKDVRITTLASQLKSIPTPYRWTPLFRSPRRLAVMDLSGMIIMPGMTLPGASNVAINPDEVIPRLRAIRNNKRIAGLLLHINSPGGSALASDVIWQAIQDVRRVKPVVAYCSDVAASGGYYLAVATDQILCRPQTITGSLGVIAGKLSFPGTLERAGINVESIYDEDAAKFTSPAHPITEEVMANFQEDARAFYRRFLQRVGMARALPRRRLHRYARGRVYTGEDAFRRGLVDKLGGFDDAIEVLAGLAQVDPITTPLLFVAHRRQTIKSAVRKSITVEHAWIDTLLQPAQVAMMLKHDPVLALLPYKVEIS